MASKSDKNGENGDRHDDGVFEKIESEELDQESSPPSYEISSYPADYTLELYVDKWKKKTITIPPFQRRFVWTISQSSKLIESFLLGLPVPPIFLYTDREDNTLLVIDGQQRLKTVAYFWEGFFGEEVHGRRPVFRLTGLNEKSPYANKTFDDLTETNQAAIRKLNDSVLRAMVIKQLDPMDDTSVYHIFERLNTGGTPLQGQEIRNCVYHGKFNDLMIELNQLSKWRSIFGKPKEDKRQRDVELILRFFALYSNAENYEKPMKDFLSKFMKRNRNPDGKTLDEYRNLFKKTIEAVHSNLASKPFRMGAGLNAAVFDSVFTAFASHLAKIPGNIEARYNKLLKDDAYVPLVTASTTDKDVVQKRLKKASQKLFG